MKVKICGITNLEDARVAVAAGADFLGFIFYPRSPRYVTPERAGQIIAALHAEGLTATTVGVFVDAPLAEIEHTMQVAGLDLAQLHGDEPVAQVQALGGRAFKALRPHSGNDVEADMLSYLSVAPDAAWVPQLLVDAYHPSAYGGTGQIGDWRLAQLLARRCARLLLAGGLTPDNVAQAIAEVRPWGVDVSSGVEASPGRKDHGRVRAFIAAARAAG
ncbi:MAG: phosphoribosylanthranilate isomerase [Anaerolineae bacterium]|nr:phosphoribosylanthranilate isomerase [Anaerolineae bacterium]MDW8100484.1 phosphoribosylanthranilate isomerase [Anaerolineae bacterium]